MTSYNEAHPFQDHARQQDHEREVDRLQGLYSTLVTLNRHNMRARTRTELFEGACKVTARHAGFVVVWIGEYDAATRRVQPLTCAGEKAEYVDHIEVYADDGPLGRGAIGTCVREDRCCVSNDFLADPSAAPWHAPARRFGLRSIAALPLHSAGRLFGAFAVYATTCDVFQEKEISLLQEMAADISFALDNLDTEARRREAEAALEARERQLSTILRTALDGFIWLSADGVFLDVNEAYCKMTGYSREELLAMRIHDVEASEDPEDVDRHLARMLRDGSHAFETTHRRKDGTVYHLEASVTRLDGGSPAFVGFVRDITERKQANEQLRKLYRAVEQSPVNIVITDTCGTIEYVNPKFTQVSGYSFDEAVGQNPRILKSGETPPEHYRRMWQTLRAGGEWRGELRNRRKNGELFWERASISAIVDESGEITHYLAVKEDITAHKALEEQLRQAQKMEAIGQLAGGVAHDFNNLLTIINGYNALVMQNEQLPAECMGSSREIQSALERASALTRQLLACSRKQAAWLRDLDLNGVVSNMSNMLRRLLKESMSLRVVCSPRPLYVHADEGMLAQVLLNLAVNARDAMREGGCLSLETSLVEGDESRPGPWVCLTVADCGSGIARDIQSRIFEPFFTTKEAGKGTGLGLAVIDRIVQQHRGWVDVESEVGEGTTFRLHFPQLAHAAATPAPAVATEASRGGDETLLVIEDDASVRHLVSRVLSALGYRVLDAANGAEALRVWEENAGGVQVLLTDLVIPDVDGIALLRRIANGDPYIRLLCMTGYSPELAGLGLELDTVIRFLPKPFRPADLAQAVRSCLDSLPSGG